MKLKSNPITARKSFKDFSPEFRSYLGPRLREIFDSCVALEKKIEDSFTLLDVGLLPPLHVRAEIKMLTDRIIDGLSAISELQKMKEVQEELQKVREAQKNVEEMALKFTPAEKGSVIKYGEFIITLSSFVFSFVLPIFSEMANEMAINPDKFWNFQIEKFSEKVKQRIGKRPETKEEMKE